MESSYFWTYLLLIEFVQVWQDELKSVTGRIWPLGRSLPTPALASGSAALLNVF